MDNSTMSKNQSTRRILSTILFIIGIGLMLVAAGIFGYQQYQYWKQDEDLGRLQAFVTTADPAQEPVDGWVGSSGEDGKPSLPAGPSVDWAGLKGESSDIIGWIQIPDTVVNYPVLHGRDNYEYLRADYYHNYAVGGSIYMDAENTRPGMVDQQTIIYGHRMNNGSMFNFVSQMSDPEVFHSVDTVWYATEDKVYELFPLFIYEAAAEGDDVLSYEWTDADGFRTYLSEHLDRALAQHEDAEKVVKVADRVLTLATCSDPYASARHILVCVEKAELEEALAPGAGLFYRVDAGQS